MSMAASDWSPYQPCPCGCEVIGWKLTKMLPGDTIQHVVGCNCARHRNKRNQKRGKRGEYNRHKRLRGGARFTPNDEHGYVYSVEIVTQDKAGKQVPASFQDFVSSAWAQSALRQAERAIPQGVVAYPALYLEPQGGGWWLVVKGT